VSIIPAYPHFSPNFNLFFSIPNTLPLSSGLWVEFCGDWVKVGVSPNTLGGLSPLVPTETLVPNKALNVYSLRRLNCSFKVVGPDGLCPFGTATQK
jgi:hypothetical protein